MAEDEPVSCDGDTRFSYDTGNLFTITSSSDVDKSFNGKYKCGWTAKEDRAGDYDTQVVIVVIGKCNIYSMSLKAETHSVMRRKLSSTFQSWSNPFIESYRMYIMVLPLSDN